MISLILLCKFSGALPAFTCASVGKWKHILICLELVTLALRAKSEGIPLHFCCLLKSRAFSTIFATFFGF